VGQTTHTPDLSLTGKMDHFLGIDSGVKHWFVKQTAPVPVLEQSTFRVHLLALRERGYSAILAAAKTQTGSVDGLSVHTSHHTICALIDRRLGGTGKHVCGHQSALSTHIGQCGLVHKD